MKMYHTITERDYIETVEVEKTNENCIWLKENYLISFDEIRITKLPRKTWKHQYWETMDEAKSYLIKKIKKEIQELQEQIDEINNKYPATHA